MKYVEKNSLSVLKLKVVVIECKKPNIHSKASQIL